MLEEIRESLRSIDHSWPNDYIIRYIYTKISVFFERDLNYFLATEEKQLELYKLGFKKQGSKIVCSNLADYHIDIFSIYKIRAIKIAASDTKIPLYSLIVEGDQGLYYLDPLNDLSRNQYGLATSFFAIIPRYQKVNSKYNLTSLSPETLRTMDTELNLQPNGIYISDFIKRLHQEIVIEENINRIYNINFSDDYTLVKKKIEIIENELINLGNVKGLYERMLIYNYLRSELLNKTERKYTRAIIDEDSMTLQFVFRPPNMEEEIYTEKQNSKGQYYLKKRG